MSDIVNQFREEELPASTVDIARAMRAARRQRRTLTVVVSAATAVAVVAAAVTGSVLFNASSGRVSPAAPTCGSPTPARPSMSSWERFDPLTSEIDASGVAGYRVTATGTATYWQTIGMINTNGDRTVAVALYACGGEPHAVADETMRVDPTAGEPADPVQGTQAYWLPPNDASSPVALAWQWTPGAWAIVAPAGVNVNPSSAELRSIATQVAQQLEFGSGSRVTSPFALPMPDGMYPAVTFTAAAADSGQPSRSAFYLGFDRIGSSPPKYIAGYVPYLWVNANALATIAGLPEGASAYAEDLGYPAYRSDFRNEGRDSDVLLVYDFFGFGMEIEPRGMPGPMDARLRYAADIFRTITVYSGAAANTSAWSDPIAP